MKKILLLVVTIVSLFASVEEAQKLMDKKEFDKAINLLTSLAQKGDLKASYLLGKAYFERKLTYADFKLSKKYLELSNYPQANLYLSKIYKEGLGIKEDIKKAIYYLKDLDSAEGNYILFTIYEDGKSTLKDFKSAFFYLEDSAKRGYKKAQYELGKLYLTNNKIVDKNLDLAAKWLKQASENGCKKSQELWDKYKLWRFENK
jgi:TPR repeat protein